MGGMYEIKIKASTAGGYTGHFHVTTRGNIYTDKARLLLKSELFYFKTKKTRSHMLDELDIATEIKKISNSKFIRYEIEE